MQKPPALGLGAFVFLATLLVLYVTPAYTGSSPVEHPDTRHTTEKIKRPTLAERLTKAEAALAHAQNDEDARHAWDHAEALRIRTLTPASRLLADEAEARSGDNHIQEASNALNAAITLQPDNALLRRTRASVRLQGNDPTGAVQDLTLSLRDDPNDPASWLLLAKAQEALHNNQKALDACQNALAHAPFFPGKDDMLTHFQKLAHGRED